MRELIFLPPVLLAHDESAARAAQSFVRRAGDEGGRGDRAGVQLRSHQTSDVGDVGHVERADLLGDGGEAVEINGAWIGGCPGNDELGAVLLGESLDFSVVKLLGLPIHAVGDNFVEQAADVDLEPVRKVAAVGQIERENRIARLERGQIDCRVGVRPGMRLHVAAIAPEQLGQPIAGQILDGVHVLAAAVVAFARIALGVLVGEHRADGLQDRLGHVVFRGDQLDRVLLAIHLGQHGGQNLRVGLGDGFKRGARRDAHRYTFAMGSNVLSWQQWPRYPPGHGKSTWGRRVESRKSKVDNQRRRRCGRQSRGRGLSCPLGRGVPLPYPAR